MIAEINPINFNKAMIISLYIRLLVSWLAAIFISGFKGEAGIVDEELSTPRPGAVFVLVPTGSGDPVAGVNTVVAVSMELVEPVPPPSPVLVIVTAVAAIFVVTGSSVMAATTKKSKL